MLLRYDPFHETDHLTSPGQEARALLAFDAIRSGDVVTISFDVPGVAPEDLDVSVERNQLTVTAERRRDRAAGRAIASERSEGTFSRQLLLDDALDLDRLEAVLEHGVLELTVPIGAGGAERKVEVSVGGGDRSEGAQRL